MGDGNNVCHSLMRIAARFGMEFVAATPAGYEPTAGVRRRPRRRMRAGERRSVSLVTDPDEAARGAHAVYTDVWASMGQEEDRERRLRDLEPYRVDAELLESADADAVGNALPAGARRARRSRPTSSTGRAASPGSKPRTACTPRRRSWRS